MPSDFVLKTTNTVHRGLVKLSGGRLGWNASHMPVLELTTTGRKSGRPHSVDAHLARAGGHDTRRAWRPGVATTTIRPGSSTLRDDPDVEVAMSGQPEASDAGTRRRRRGAGAALAARHRRPQELRRLPDQDQPRDPARPARARGLIVLSSERGPAHRVLARCRRLARPRLDDWRALFSANVTVLEAPTATHVRMRLRSEGAAIDDARRRWRRQEVECCPFFMFAIEIDADGLVFTASRPARSGRPSSKGSPGLATLSYRSSASVLGSS